VPALVINLLPEVFVAGEVTKGTVGETFGNTKIRGQAASAAIGIDTAKMQAGFGRNHKHE